MLGRLEFVIFLLFHHIPSVAEFFLELILSGSSGKAGFGLDVSKDFGDGWPESRSVAK